MNQARIKEIQTQYELVREKINLAARRSGRDPAEIRLVVVTKTHSMDTVMAAIDAGVRDLGENYAEEAVEKIHAVGQVDKLTWHMIGHVQSRKAGLVALNFDLLHSLDSFRLAERLNRFANEAGRILPVLLECNLGGEESKSGFLAITKNELDILAAEARQIAGLSNLEIRGLMCMPPLDSDAEKSRPYFKKMKGLQAHLAVEIPQCSWNELSMGTSTDYSVAVEEGATMVRVGTAILGARPPKNQIVMP